MTERYERVAIVTGATSGIGEATARRLVGIGYGVLGNGRNGDKLAALGAELGTAFQGLAGDAAEAALPQRLFEQAETHFGQAADLIVVNAGRGLGGAVTEADPEAFEQVVRINLLGALRLMQQAASRLVALQDGRFPERAADIVVIGSTVGRNLSPFSAVYGSTKFAVHSLAEGLRREIGPKGVRVSLVEPGVVLSGFQEGAGYSDELVARMKENFGPLLYGEDIADTIEYIVTRAPHVHVNEVMVRSTRQDYP